MARMETFPRLSNNNTGNEGLISKTNSFFKSSARRLAHSTDSSPYGQQDSHRLSGLSPHRSSLSRRSSSQTYNLGAASSSTPSFRHFSDGNAILYSHLRRTPSSSTTTLLHRPSLSQPSAIETVCPGVQRTSTIPSPLPSLDMNHSARVPLASAPPFSENLRRENTQGKPSSINGTYQQGANNGAASIGGPQNPSLIYQHIQDMSAKRISTLGYLRKA